MAAPITHIVLSVKMFEKRFSGANMDEFLIGTSFPDIRYLANLDRDITHFENLEMDDVLAEKDPFMAGFYFHSIVDKETKRFFEQTNVYSYFSPGDKNIPEAVKTIFDITLQKKICDWRKISGLFDKVLEKELTFQAPKTIVKQWHTMLQNYFEKMPHYESCLQEYIVNDPKIVTENITKSLNNLGEGNRIVIGDLAEKFYANFDSIIKN